MLAEDDAGKRRVEERDDKALFFMPHCPRRLYSNLLWANWAPDALPRLVVAGNRYGVVRSWSGDVGWRLIVGARMHVYHG